MKSSIRQMTRGAVALALVVATGSAALAQQPVASGGAVPARGPVVPGDTGVRIQKASPNDTIRFDLDFPGGTVVEFVESVSKAQGTLVNVVIPEDLKLVMIPEMKMTQVNASSLLQAASHALTRTRTIKKPLPGGGTYFDRQEVGYRFQPIAEEVWTFMALGGSDDQILEDQSVVFFSLRPYLNRYSIDDVITVIEAGNQLQPGSKPLSLKFHKETKLLVVRGTPGDLDIVKGALSQLRDDWDGSLPFPEPPPPAPAPAATPPQPK